MAIKEFLVIMITFISMTRLGPCKYMIFTQTATASIIKIRSIWTKTSTLLLIMSQTTQL